MTDNTFDYVQPDVWSGVLHIIQSELSEQSFNTWFNGVECASLDDEKAVLSVPDKFYGEWLKDHYQEIIRDAFHKAANIKPAIEYQLSTTQAPPKPSAPAAQPAKPSQANKNDPSFTAKDVDKNDMLRCNIGYTFDEFVVGSSNRFAHAASVAISESPAKTYNPFFIYGPSGLGKTHLLQAIAHKIKNRFPEKKVYYTSSEAFTNLLINAIHQRKTPEFRKKFRSLDVLIIDDIHFIAGKESTQEEFFHTFNTLYDAKKQIVLSSDRSPKEIASLEMRLISRFEWGLITDIQLPDFETRVAILKKKLEKENVEVSNDVLFYIAEHIKTNIRELEGALIRVCAYGTLTERPITLSVVENILHTSVYEEERKITIDTIQQYVADEYNLKVSDLRSKNRSKTIAYPRHIAMYLARKHTPHSLPEIGASFGGRSHATVVHACSKIEDLVQKKCSSLSSFFLIEKKLFKTL